MPRVRGGRSSHRSRSIPTRERSGSQHTVGHGGGSQQIVIPGIESFQRNDPTYQPWGTLIDHCRRRPASSSPTRLSPSHSPPFPHSIDSPPPSPPHPNDNIQNNSMSGRESMSRYPESSIGEHSDPRKLLDIESDGNFNNEHVVRDIAKWIKEHYNGPWASWKEFPQYVQNNLWNKFKAKYRWRENMEPHIKDVWNNQCSRRVTSILSRARGEAIRRTPGATWIGEVEGNNPIFIPLEHWNKLVRDRWSNEEWREKSKIAKRNRGDSSSGNFSKHTGGSVTFCVTKRRLAKTKTHVDHLQLFKHTHSYRDGDRAGQYVDDKSREVAEKYTEGMREKFGDDASSQPSMDLDTWLSAAGKSSKNRVYGLTQQMRNSCYSTASSQAFCSETDDSQVQTQLSTLTTTVGVLSTNYQEIVSAQTNMQTMMMELLREVREVRNITSGGPHNLRNSGM